MEPNSYTHMHTIHGVHVCVAGVHDCYIPRFHQLQHVQGMGSTKWRQERGSEDESACITFHVFLGPERATSFSTALTHIYNLLL